jgi:MFS family permease
LSTGEISSLFVIWSLTGILLEVPTGALADVMSRRLLQVLGAATVGVGYAVWTVFPSYPAFAIGFVLWGLGSALTSGSYEAYVYDELAAKDAVSMYPRIIARGRALGLVLNLTATVIAGWLLDAGGYALVGAVSVAACAVQALVALSLPRDVRRHREHSGFREYVRMLRLGVGEARHSPVVRAAVLTTAVLMGFLTYDEYYPLLAEALGASLPLIPLLIGLTVAGQALGALLAPRVPYRGLVPVLIAAAVLLGAGALSGHPVGFVPIAVGYGLLQLAIVLAETKLQDVIEGEARATVTSVTGLLSELAAIAMFAGIAFGSLALSLPTLLAMLSGGLLAVGIRSGFPVRKR